jgi:threonine/homoserine/homoserine lactone efflux protein
MHLLEFIWPVALFGLVSTGTPGPNNIMVTTSGVNFGFRKTVPHIFGIATGFAVMNLAVGLGMGHLFSAYPMLHEILKIVCIFYLIYLASRIAGSGSHEKGQARQKPLTFLHAAGFQWVNPKAWVIAISAVSTFATTGGEMMREMILISLVFFLVTLPTASLWTYSGTLISSYLRTPKHLKAFNWVMAGLLMASLVPILI